ncbi:zinc ribbon domain-containing protein [Ktedonosporobacter rubrisoli]|uniref:Zinc ribbon domain-containing protein n=1 Tax=Ktedonosporobacter rubrisoli TaxID=2509675 RepID=A0A4P6JWJ5_KTERU|nr:FmdB family zinc ribbon protein [Ktedonosporobacter rubrisoli]QBD80077.1 zinc ribbon domain-containing protein [Ktedonosporobacter rubrisoli]
MPRYEFLCERCGSFECWRPLAEASEPQRCPECKALARRVYTLPGLVKTPLALSRALYRAEKSAHEPEVVRRASSASQGEKPAQIISQSHGRPWQVEH